jgi:hypothetical protein
VLRLCAALLRRAMRCCSVFPRAENEAAVLCVAMLGLCYAGYQTRWVPTLFVQVTVHAVNAHCGLTLLSLLAQFCV